MRGIVSGCLLQIAVIGWLAVLAVLAAVLAPSLSHTNQQFLVPAVLVLWIGTIMPATLVGGIAVVLRRNRRLDAVFQVLGAGRALAPVARAWACERNGRVVNAWFSKGPQLELYLSARPETSAVFGLSNRVTGVLAGVFGQRTIALGDGMIGSGRDEAWVQRVIAEPGVGGALAALLRRRSGSSFVQVHPDAVKLTWRRFDLDELDATALAGMLDDLELVATVADRVPAPAMPETASGLVSRMRTRRGSLGTFLGITLGLTAFLLMLVGGASLLVLVFAHR